MQYFAPMKQEPSTSLKGIATQKTKFTLEIYNFINIFKTQKYKIGGAVEFE
jgi:hypothetical protein